MQDQYCFNSLKTALGAYSRSTFRAKWQVPETKTTKLTMLHKLSYYMLGHVIKDNFNVQIEGKMNLDTSFKCMISNMVNDAGIFNSTKKISFTMENEYQRQLSFAISCFKILSRKKTKEEFMILEGKGNDRRKSNIGNMYKIKLPNRKPNDNDLDFEQIKGLWDEIDSTVVPPYLRYDMLSYVDTDIFTRITRNTNDIIKLNQIKKHNIERKDENRKNSASVDDEKWTRFESGGPYNSLTYGRKPKSAFGINIGNGHNRFSCLPDDDDN